MTRKTTYRSIVLTALAITPPLAAAPPQPVDVVAIYAIDSTTYELVRYAFADDTTITIGKVKTKTGTQVKDCESLGYVPPGPGFGMYSVPTTAPYERQLVRIDPLTATATVVGPAVCSAGRKITGMLSNYDPVTREWYLVAASSVKQTSSRTAIETRELVRINPITGTSTIIATQAQLGSGLRFEGLGIDSDGNIYATSRTRFFRIHQEAGYWVQDLGATSLDKCESFEVAFGDTMPSLTVPGVNPTWTTKGVFFAFDEQIKKFGVINPATGAFTEYKVNGKSSKFLMEDAEGMVLLTLSRDPLYGMFITHD